MEYGIHWFRRDLRIAGNDALKVNFKKNKGKVVGIFCFDKSFLSRPDFSHNRFQFFIESLFELRNELRTIGSDLLVLDMEPLIAWKWLIDKLKKKNNSLPGLITWNRDYEPFARTRDEKIEKYLNEISLNVKNFRDHLLIEPDELFKEDNSGYQVYSPFARKWMELAQTPLMRQRIQSQIEGFKYLDKLQSGVQEKIFSLSWSELLDKIDITNDTLLEFRKLNLKKVTIPIPKAGSIEAFKRLKEYKNDLSEYKDCRDYPALKKTSKFSIYLKNGSLTVPQILAYYELTPYKKKQSAEDTFYSELVWREFYYHILYRHPYVEKSCFLKIYDSIKWENSEKNFEKWKNGQTGFPIVDAGMRELKQTGWMHNRVRMIVASFLVKDLLIDWRWGEKYFMEQLLDGDLAPNNGGWQWAASTGCDPQPYFRIFNPWLQSLKFDSDGEYIFKYLPELIGKVSAKKIHEPLNIIGYPEPIVDHKVQREKALNLYKLAGKKIN